MRVCLWTPGWIEHSAIWRNVRAACSIGLADAGHVVEASLEVSEETECVVTWGLGHPASAGVMRGLVKCGVAVVGWDLGYWSRSTHYRVSVNAIHPQAIVMARRREARPGTPTLRSDDNPNGPIVLVGIGRKSAATYDEKPGEWERDTLQRIKDVFPSRRILFRPRERGSCLAELPHTETVDGPIEGVLKGASLAVCRHSNVAVDAIIAGVPVIADDGAAAAICPHKIEAKPRKSSYEVRSQFLANLSWFQWSKVEMREPATWRAIAEMVEDAKERGVC